MRHEGAVGQMISVNPSAAEGPCATSDRGSTPNTSRDQPRHGHRCWAARGPRPRRTSGPFGGFRRRPVRLGTARGTSASRRPNRLSSPGRTSGGQGSAAQRGAAGDLTDEVRTSPAPEYGMDTLRTVHRGGLRGVSAVLCPARLSLHLSTAALASGQKSPQSPAGGASLAWRGRFWPRRRVRVAGEIVRRFDGRAEAVEVSEIHVLPGRNELPQPGDIRGLVPDLTGGVPPSEWLRGVHG